MDKYKGRDVEEKTRRQNLKTQDKNSFHLGYKLPTDPNIKVLKHD